MKISTSLAIASRIRYAMLQRNGYAIALSALLFTACSTPSQTAPTSKQIVEEQSEEPAVSDVGGDNSGPELPPGSNEMLRAPLTLAEGTEVIVSDVIIPPNATVPRHYHPGEEFVYIIEGSVVHVEEGKPEFILKAGEATTIAPKREHEPRGTEEGARAIVFRVHPEGEEPERTLVEGEHSHDRSQNHSH